MKECFNWAGHFVINIVRLTRTKITSYMVYIKNNACVTVNSDFWSRVKIISEWPHSWQKIIIYGTECIILFLIRYFMSWIHNTAKNIIDRWFRHCRYERSFLTLHCDVTTVDLWRHAKVGAVNVTSYSSIVLACARRSSLVNNNHEYWFFRNPLFTA